MRSTPLRPIVGLRLPAEPLLALLLPLSLAACGGGPRPTAFDDRPSVPVRLADLAAGRVGALELDRVDPAPASRLRLAKPFRSADQGDGWRTYLFDPPSPVTRVRQILTEDGSTTPQGAVCVLRPGDGPTSARRGHELAAAGLAPTALAGLAALRGGRAEAPTLLTATADPKTLLAFRDGRVVAVLRETRPGAVTSSLPMFLPRDELGAAITAATTDRLRALLTALEQDLPLAGRSELAAHARGRLYELDVASWAGMEERAQDWDARLAAAADLDGRLALMADQSTLLRAAFPDDAPLSGEAAAWRNERWQLLRDELEAALAVGTDAGEASSSEVLERYDEFRRDGFASLLGARGDAAWRRFRGRVAWERIRLAAVDRDDPFVSTLDELDLLLRDDAASTVADFAPDSRLIGVCLGQAAARLRAFAERGGGAHPRDGDRALALATALGATLPDSLPRLRDDCATIIALRSHLATPIPDIDQEVVAWTRLAPGLRAMAHDDRTPALEEEVRYALGGLARRAAALSRAAGSATDRATLRAFDAALRVEPLGLDTLAQALELLEAARGLDLDPDQPRARRLAALEDLANRQSRFGPLAALVTAELALPLGRELAAEAERLTIAGAHARAAELLLAAASVGSADGPAPKATAALRREAAGLRERAGEADPDRDALRAYWLHRAQVEVLLAVGPLLPLPGAEDPAAPLQSRFLARQLGGTARWPQRYGLRLTDLGDVERSQTGADPVRLALRDGTPRWVPLDSPATAFPPADLGADPADWEEIGRLAAAVTASREALATAQAGRDLSRPELEDRDRVLIDRIRELEVAIDRGQLDPLTARTRIDRLQREADALRGLLANFNDRSRHIEARAADHNQQIRIYNAALRAALADLESAFRKALGPATEAWIRDRLDELPLDDRERRLRAALCGIGPPDFERASRPAHPIAVAARLRDLIGARPAAAGLARALRQRLADSTYNAGVAATDHVARLAPAFDLYATEQGAEAFARILLRDALGDLEPLHPACVATVAEEAVRQAIERDR